MDLIDTVVVYDGLPISGGGAHGLGRISPRDALRSWIRFLEERTVAAPIKARFDFPQTPGIRVERRLLKLIENAFGQRSMRLVTRALGQPPMSIEVPSSGFDDAVALFESLEPLPTNDYGMAPVWLWFTADFQMRSPNGPGVWPGQAPANFGDFRTPNGIVLGASSTRLILEARRAMGLSLSIPRASDADLQAVVPWLQAELPMKLSSKHWTRWTLARDGHSYRGRKLIVS